MDWPKDAALTTDQTGHPILWHNTLRKLGFTVPMPKLNGQWFIDLWGDRKTSRRLKTFGHTDPGYTRYALQIQLYNDGFIVHGLEDNVADMPLFFPGLVILLDTWSPHQVARDPRLASQGPNKMLCGADFAERPDIEHELPKLVAHVPTLMRPSA